jgi:hypothetical protein
LTEFAKGYLFSESHENPKYQNTNPKWFDKLTTLSSVEGQIPINQIQNSKRLPSTSYIRPELMSKAGPEHAEGESSQVKKIISLSLGQYVP